MTTITEPPCCVLVVDDYKPALQVARRVLREHRVLTAETPEEARRIAAEEHPALAIVDVVLGPWSGIDLIRELKAEGPDLVAVAYTAQLSTEIAFEAAKAGAVRTESKHRSLSDLCDEVRSSRS